ncbi:MAG TPA: transglutaminase domain-containing protein, partial [Chitinophagaceae bacterium]
VKNLTTKKREVFQPSWREIMPSVLLAPSSFGVGNYEGNMDTWQNYGKFINDLRSGRDVLPDDIKQKVHTLTDNVKDPHEKINILYNYLQQNSRYVSVQLGVGGWQPFDAKYVATNKYGDCKALSNYMIALLKEAGVKANYVEIRAGEGKEPIQTDFPMTQFNHVTVCVPLDKDSVWLECTSQTQATGYAGTFTGDRYALLTDENGGHIVATPHYTSKDNQVIRNVQASLDASGNLSAKVSTHFTGCETDDLSLDLEALTKQQFDEKLKSEFDIPTYDVSEYAHKETKNRIPSIDESFELTANNYSSVTGKRVFLKPNLLTYSSGKLDTSEPRKYDIVLTHAFKHVDSITIALASDYTIESLPKDVLLNTPYGIYSIQFRVDNNIVYCVRSLKQNVSRFPAADYQQFAAFMNSIYKSDRSKIVFIKKES